MVAVDAFPLGHHREHPLVEVAGPNYAILHYVILHNRLNRQEMKSLSNSFVIGDPVASDAYLSGLHNKV